MNVRRKAKEVAMGWVRMWDSLSVSVQVAGIGGVWRRGHALHAFAGGVICDILVVGLCSSGF